MDKIKEFFKKNIIYIKNFIFLIVLFVSIMIVVNMVFFAHDSQAVYTTKYGTVYHSKDCHYTLNSGMNRMAIEEAEKKGYTPCKLCIENMEYDPIVYNDYATSAIISFITTPLLFGIYAIIVYKNFSIDKNK